MPPCLFDDLFRRPNLDMASHLSLRMRMGFSWRSRICSSGQACYRADEDLYVLLVGMVWIRPVGKGPSPSPMRHSSPIMPMPCSKPGTMNSASPFLGKSHHLLGDEQGLAPALYALRVFDTMSMKFLACQSWRFIGMTDGGGCGHGRRARA